MRTTNKNRYSHCSMLSKYKNNLMLTLDIGYDKLAKVQRCFFCLILDQFSIIRKSRDTQANIDDMYTFPIHCQKIPLFLPFQVQSEERILLSVNQWRSYQVLRSE